MEKDWWNKEKSKGYYDLEVKEYGALIREDGEIEIERRGREYEDSIE